MRTSAGVHALAGADGAGVEHVFATITRRKRNAKDDVKKVLSKERPEKNQCETRQYVHEHIFAILRGVGEPFAYVWYLRCITAVDTATCSLGCVLFFSLYAE